MGRTSLVGRDARRADLGRRGNDARIRAALGLVGAVLRARARGESEVRARTMGTSDRGSRHRRLRPARAVFRAWAGGWEGFSAPRRFLHWHLVLRVEEHQGRSFPARDRNFARALRAQTYPKRRLDGR